MDRVYIPYLSGYLSTLVYFGCDVDEPLAIPNSAATRTLRQLSSLWSYSDSNDIKSTIVMTSLDDDVTMVTKLAALTLGLWSEKNHFDGHYLYQAVICMDLIRSMYRQSLLTAANSGTSLSVLTTITPLLTIIIRYLF
jgi:hypothetical protein